MSKYKNRNTKLNPQVMNNVRIRKSVSSILYRSGLICLLFLMPWVSNLKAQPYYGLVGIDDGNKMATLKILDDDNLNSTSTTEGLDSRKRRTIIVDKVSDGTEGTTPGSSAGSTNIQFKVRFFNNGTAAGYPAATTAVSDVWAFFKINDGTANGGASYAEGIDYAFPTVVSGVIEKVADRIYKVKIPEGDNESAVITLNVFGDNKIELLENLHIELLSNSSYAPYADPAIESETTGVATVFPVETTPYEFTITDATGSAANKVLSITPTTNQVIWEGATSGTYEKATIRVSLPANITSATPVVTYLDVTAVGGATRTGDYTVTELVAGTLVKEGARYKVTIPANTEYVEFEVKAPLDNILFDNGDVTFRGTLTGITTGYTWNSSAIASTVEIKDKDNEDANKLKLEVISSKSPINGDGADITNITVRFVDPNVKTAVPITIDLSQKSGTAVATTNYTWRDGQQVIIPGDSNSRTSNAVRVRGENAHVLGGSWTLVIKGTASGYPNIADASVTIIDKNIEVATNRVISFTESTVTLNESISPNTAKVHVQLPAGFTTAADIRVPVELSIASITNPATYNVDYSLSPDFTIIGHLVIEATKGNGEVTITGIPDVYVEGTEQFRIVKGAAPIESDHGGSYTFTWHSTQNSCLVNILDNEIAGARELTITPVIGSPQEIHEGVTSGANAKATIKVAPGSPSSSPIELLINVNENGGAVRPGDYVVAEKVSGTVSKVGSQYKVVIPANAEYIEFEVTAPLDNVLFDNGYVIFEGGTISSAGYSWKGGTQSSRVDIKDKDSEDANKLKLEVISSKSPINGDGADITNITVRFVDPNVKTAVPITIDLSQKSGTAVVTTNYTWRDGQQVIIPGDSNSRTSNAVRVRGENAHVLGGSWTLVIKGTASGYPNITDASVTIVDKNHLDPNNLIVNFDPSAYEVNEDQFVEVIIKLKDGYTTFNELSIPIKIDNDAARTTAIIGTGNDYTVSNPTITATGTVATAKILAGESEVRIRVNALADNVEEADEFLYFMQAGAITGSVGYTHQWGTADEAKVTIKNVTTNANNKVVTIELLDKAGVSKKTELLRSTSATGDVVTIKAKLNTIFSMPVEVTLAGAGTIGSDFTFETSNKIIIPAGATEASITVWASCNYTVTDIRKLILSATAATNPASAVPGLTVAFKDNVNTIDVLPVGIDNGIVGSSVVCFDESLTLTAQAAPAGRTFTYKWYVDGTEISGADSHILVVPAGSKAADVTYTYKVVITAEHGCKREFTHTVKVNRQPNADLAISSNSPEGICGNANVLITATTSESSPFTYTWYRLRTGETVPDAALQTGTSNTYNITDNVSGKYWVVTELTATGCTRKSSNELTFTFGSGETPATPIIDQAPTASFCEGGSVVLTVSKTGGGSYPSGTEYEWYRKPNASSAATLYTTITDGNTLPVSEGGIYSVIVKVGGCVSSESVAVTVTKSGTTLLPQPIVDPSSTAPFCAGGSVTITVQNTEAGATYQWYFNPVNSNVGGVALAGEIGASIAADVEGYYYVIMSKDGCSSLPSVPVHAEETGSTVSIPTPELNYTGSTTYCAGGSVTLSVTNLPIADYPGVTFQWHDLGGPISGQTGRSYHASTNGTYWVVANDGSGCQTKASDKVVVSQSGGPAPAKPKIESEGGAVEICAANGTLRLTAINSVTNAPYTEAGLTYVWYFENNQIDGPNVSNVHHALGSRGPGMYSVKVFDGTCESEPAYFEVISVGTGTAPATPVISRVTAPGDACVNGTITLQVDSPKDDTYTYQWYGVNQGLLVGKEGASMAVGVTDSYYVIVKNAAGCASEESNKLPVVISSTGTPAPAAPVIDVTPATFCDGGSYTIDVTNAAAYAGLNPIYQWHGLSQGVIAGETGSSIVVSVADTYRVLVIIDGCQSPLSGDKKVTKSGTVSDIDAPVIAAIGGNVICTGGSVALEVTNLDAYDLDNISFQWFNSKGKIVGATDPTYHAQEEDPRYYVVATDGTCQSLASNEIPLTMGVATDLDEPKITSTSNHVICENGSADLVAVKLDNSEFESGVKYTWYRDGVNIGTTVYNRITVTEAGRYRVVVKKGDCGSKESAEYPLTIDYGNFAPAKPVIKEHPSTTIVSGGTRTLNVTSPTGTGMKYDWYKVVSGEYVYLGTTVNKYYDVTSAGDYAVIAIDGGCRSIHSDITKVVEIEGTAPEKPAIKVVNGSSELCVNGTVELRAVKANDMSDYPSGTQFIWYFEDPQGSGKVTLSETSMTLQVTQRGWYSVRVADSGFGESEESAQKEVTQGTNTGVPAQPKILSEGGATQVCAANGTLQLTAVKAADNTTYPTGSGLMFKWFRDGEEVQYSTSPVYHAPGSIAVAKYTVVVLDGVCASLESADFTVTGGTGSTAPNAPVIEAIGGITDICSGGTVTLQVKDAITNGSVTYHWFSLIQGDLHYEGASIAVSAEDHYYAVAKNAAGCPSAPSNKIFVSVSGSGTAPVKPQVNSTTGEFCKNGSYTIDVTNLGDYGSNVEFEWHAKVGGVITGQTGSSLIVTSANTYWVVAVDKDTNCKSVSSDNVVVSEGAATVDVKKPVIALENGAVNGEICINGSATIRITNLTDYTGLNVTYQWYNSKGKIVGATLPSYIATEADDDYHVVVIGTCQSLPSNSVELVMGSNTTNIPAPKIVADPDTDPAMMCANGSIKLTAVKAADGSAYPTNTGLKFKWYVNGIIDASITGPVYVAEVKGLYEVVITDGSECQSLPASKKVEIGGGDASDLFATIQYTSTSFCAGGSVQLTAVPQVAGNYTYEWYLNDQPIPGATTGAIYTATVEGNYSVVVKDGTCNSKRSDNVHISQSTGTAPAKPKILPEGNQQFCLNGSVELEAVSTGAAYDSTVEYFWYENGVLLQSGPSNTYNASVAGDYYVIVFNGCWSDKSDYKHVTVDNSNTAPVEPVITVEPGNQTVCTNGSVKLTANPKTPVGSKYPTTGLTYKWYKDHVKVAETTANVYHAPWVIGDATVTYTVTVSDANCQSVESAGVDITPSGNSAPNKPELTPSSESLCVNGMVIITVTNPTAGVEYEWYRDGVWVQNTYVPEYHTMLPGKFNAIAVDNVNCRSALSDTITITLSGNTAPNQPSISPDIATMCAGGSVELKSTDGGQGVEYLWFKDGAHVATTLSRYYLATAPGVYRVAVKEGNNGCISMESANTATVSETGSITDVPYITAPSHELCTGLNLVLTANVDSPTGTITGYRWYEETKGFLHVTTKTLPVTEEGKYRVVVEIDGLCQSVASAEWEVIESNDPNCMSSSIILEVDHNELLEGSDTYIRVKLAPGLVASTNMKIDLAYSGSALRGPCVVGSGLGDYQIVSGTPLEIVIPQGASMAEVKMTTCADFVYEGVQNVIISATYDGGAVSQSPQEVKIIDGDSDNEDKLRLKWALMDTHHSSGRNDVVNKGQTAELKLTAFHPTLDIPISVEAAQNVGLEYVLGAHPIADPGTQYTQVAMTTIPAGDSIAIVQIVTINDGVVERSERVVISDIEPVHLKMNPAQNLYIQSNGLNAFGGFDFNVKLAPLSMAGTEAEVVEGGKFELTVELTDQSMVVGEDVFFDLAQINTGLPNMAIAGVDFTMGSEIKMLEGTNTVTVYITTIDDDLFSGDKQLDIEVTPRHADDRIVNRTPDPLVGMILEDDKLCITITSSEEGLDDVITAAEITVEVHNISPNVGGIVIQLENTNPFASHFIVPNEFTPMGSFILSAANPTHQFTITSTLAPPVNPNDFDIRTYISVYEEIQIDINYTYSSVAQESIDCFEPLTLVISDDFDKDGLPNWLERKNPNCDEDNGDSNNNGILNEWDPYDPNADDDGDGIPNWMEDTNRDGNPYNDFAGSSCLPNFANPDSDGDGVPDSAENWTNRPYDDNDGDIRIHPALSLNDDGIGNDKLYIENINKYPDNKVTVFDRQGIVVYEQTAYDNKDRAFNGIANKAKSGKKVPMGTYFVIVEYVKDGSKKYYDKAVEVRY